MDLSQLKNTSDEQFKKDVTFNAMMPSDEGEPTETDIELTIKSVRNPEVRAKFSKLISAVTKETAKVEKPNVSDEAVNKIAEKISALEIEICGLIFVGFSGLMDGDKPMASNDKNKAMLVNDYEWIRKNIVNKASSTDAFYKA